MAPGSPCTPHHLLLGSKQRRLGRLGDRRVPSAPLPEDTPHLDRMGVRRGRPAGREGGGKPEGVARRPVDFGDPGHRDRWPTSTVNRPVR